MADILNNLIISNFVLLEFLFSLGLSIIIGLGVAFIYKITHKGLNYESSFLATLALLAPIVTLVMYFIRGNLVLSLGLVGSLSIIRFRTPIKDTKDMIFLFWTIAAGLGIGTLNWTITIIATVVLGLLMYVFYKVRYGRQVHNQYILMLSGHENFSEAIIKNWTEKGIMQISLRSREIENNNFQVVYELRFLEKNLEQIHAFISELQADKNIDKVSLLSPQLNLPM